MDDQIIALAQTIPTWKAVERFYPGVEATSTQDGPDGRETIVWPEGFDAPTAETLFAHKLQMAREFLATQYQRDRAGEYPAVGDSVDAILKALAAMAEQGIVTLPEDTIQVLARCREVKEKYPKHHDRKDPAHA